MCSRLLQRSERYGNFLEEVELDLGGREVVQGGGGVWEAFLEAVNF